MVTIPYIALIINTSIATKVFPKPWKHSIKIPIHKSGDIDEPTNFRPINLLTILSKAPVNVTEQIYKYIDETEISLLFLLELSKAFDSVNQDLLLNKFN